MKLNSQCILCLLKRHEETALKHGDQEQATAFIRDLMRLLSEGPADMSAPFYTPGITKLFTEHFLAIAPDYVKVEVIPHHGGDGFLIPISSPAYKAAEKAVEEVFGRKHTKGNTCSNLSSSRALSDVTVAHGGEYAASAVGEVNVVAKMKAQGISLSQLIARIEKYQNSGEINFRLEDKKGAMDAVRDYFMQAEKATAYMDFDGYRVEFPDWWFNIRPSNTEPYLRFICEASSEELLKEKLETVNEILKTKFGA